MRVLLTGASGFTGRYVAEALGGHEALDAEATVVGFDVTQPDSTRAALDAVRPEALIHLAARTLCARE